MISNKRFFSPEAAVRSISDGYVSQNVEVKVIRQSPFYNGVVWSILRVIAINDAPLWNLKAYQSKDTICCNAVEQKNGMWVLRRIEEEHRPAMYDCPIDFLNAVAVDSDDWRENAVRYRQLQQVPSSFDQLPSLAMA